MHSTKAAIVAVVAVSVKLVVVLAQVAENVVVPQPVVDVVSELVLAVNLGNTNVIVLLLLLVKGTFNTNVNDIADGADVKGFEMIRLLVCKTDFGTTAVDVLITVAAMLL